MRTAILDLQHEIVNDLYFQSVPSIEKTHIKLRKLTPETDSAPEEYQSAIRVDPARDVPTPRG